jgi:hypothetical protein
MFESGTSRISSRCANVRTSSVTCIYNAWSCSFIQLFLIDTLSWNAKCLGYRHLVKAESEPVKSIPTRHLVPVCHNGKCKYSVSLGLFKVPERSTYDLFSFCHELDHYTSQLPWSDATS